MLFKSDLTFIENVYSVIEAKKIPQLYRADMKFATQQGDEKFALLLQQIGKLFEGDGFTQTSIDTRTHMLMKGMYPCIPGWHCDDFYRPDGNQPDLKNVEKDAPQKHYMVVLGDCSLTEFLEFDERLPDPDRLPTENPAYFYYDEILEKQIYSTRTVEPNKIYSFGPTAFHRGSPAKENGFRTFIRVTRSNHREPKNEIRYQSNVYLAGRTSW